VTLGRGLVTIRYLLELTAIGAPDDAQAPAAGGCAMPPDYNRRDQNLPR